MLYTDRRREVEGATRFQKLVFLAQNEEKLGELFEYQADKYGPFSKELAKSLDELQNEGLIWQSSSETRSNNERYNYGLTDYGVRVVKKQLNDSDGEVEDILDAAESVKKDHNEESIQSLLRYVYRKYPKYTEQSKLDI